MTKKLTIALFGLSMALVVAPSTEAASIRIWDGVNAAIIIADNGVGDIDLDPGEMQSLTTFYGVWTVTFTAAQTTPALGSPTEPEMEFIITASSSGAGNLFLDFSETGFSSGPNAIATVDGTFAGGSLTYTTYQDLGNTLFAQTTLLTSQPFPPGAIPSALALGTVDPGSPYSLTQRVVINHTAPGASSVSTTLSVPDGGFTLSLLGFGLMGIEGLRRKFKV